MKAYRPDYGPKGRKPSLTIGQRFGRLTVEEHVRGETWLMRCDCGNRIDALTSNLKAKRTQSCGCYRRERSVTHGWSRTREYRIWNAMRYRCENPKNTAFPHYGGRGITVCERWQRFENFLADMGPAPSRDHSIDRINVNGGYHPENCRWATQAEQKRNTRSRKRAVLDSMTIEELEAALEEKRKGVLA